MVSGSCAPRRQRGMTLIELMISMAIGLIMIGAMLLAYLSNTATTRSMLASTQLQEHANFAFDYLARDIREAGSRPCGCKKPPCAIAKDTANVLNSSPNVEWAEFKNDLRGFESNEDIPELAAFDGEYGERVAGTDALRLAINDGKHFSIEEHKPTSAQFKINGAGHSFNSGDIVFVCDYQQSSIFQITNANTNNATIVHNTGTGSPGNCTKGLGSPVQCTTNGTPYTYGKNSVIAAIRSATWYVGCNTRADCSTPAGRSVFFTYLSGGSLLPQDLVDGVVDFQIKYLSSTGNNYVDASAVNIWENIVGVEVYLTLQQPGGAVGTDGRDIQRTFEFAVAVRGRLS